MKLKKRFSISFLLSLLCMAFLANGQISPIAVVGTDTLCPTSSATYLTTPLTGIHFIWTVTPLALVGMTPIGTISGPNNLDSVSVFWGLAGMARVRVWGYDSANVLVDTGSIVVTVLHAPAPFITENVRVGCQQLTDTSQGDVKRPGGIIDDKYGCIKVCEGSIVTYTGWGAATDTFGWVIVGGTIITAGADTCQVKWGYTGMGSVTVFDTSQYGCIGQKHVCIEIIPKPHALFKIMPASSPSYCLGQSLVFVDHSVDSGGSPIVSWFWDFGDGTLWPASSSTSLTHEYSVAGTYTAKLIVTNACGCKDTFRMKINISEKAGVNIICPGVSCQGAIDSYSLSPVITCTSYIWTAIGGTIVTPMGPSIAVQWNSVDTSGFGYLFFNSGPCTTCPGLTTIKVPVILSHGHISGPKKVCADNAYLFNMPQWPSTVFNWTVTGTATATLAHTDQNNQMVMYPHGSGVIYLKCTYNNTLLGCGGTAIDTITILPPDSIIGQAKVCLNDSSSYSLAGVPGITGDWSIVYPDGMTILTGTGHTSPAFPFTQVGTYILTVVPDIMSVPAFCSIAPFLVTVGPLPVTPDGITGPDTVCYGTPINYTAYNPIAGDIFEWTISAGTINFVDGNTTVATFAGAGPDIIAVRRATMSSPHCYSHYFNKLVARPFVHPHITGLDTVCPSSLSIYDGNYYEGETYSWKVYPSTMGSVQTDGFSGAGILWNNTSGPATIVVTIRKCSLNYTDTFHVWVRAMPLTFSITLSADSICRGASITATAGIGGTIAWSWGDSSVLTSADSVNPASHIYHILAGHNLVDTLTAISTNPWGCLAVVIAKRAVIILPAPVAFISPAGPYNYCVGSPSETLTATIQSGYEPTDSLLWMRTTTTVPIIGCITPFPCAAQTFTTWGVYYVIAEGINGCRDTSNYVSIDSVDCSGGTGGTCTLTPEPTVGLSVSSHCGIVTLTGSYSALPTELSTTWNYPFLDATIISMSPTVLTCSFRTAGLYDFTYVVSFTDGVNTCNRQASATALVKLVPGIGYEANCAPGGAGYNVTILDHCNYFPGYMPTFYSWYLNGIHQATTLASTYTTLVAPGTYVLGEWVHYGATDSCFISTTVVFSALPVASFTFARDTTCADQASVQFTNTSLPVGGSWTSFWGFNDPLTTNSQNNPFHTFPPPTISGGYKVGLTITNEYGCKSIDSEFVPIKNRILGGILLGPTRACSGNPVILTYSATFGTSAPETYYWNNDTTFLYYTLTGSTSVYTSGAYWTRVTDHYGCTANTPVHNVTFTQIPPALIDGSTSQCFQVPYTLNGWAGDGPGITYKWYRDGILVSSADSYTDPATSAGTFVYRLVITVATLPSGTCSDTSANDTVMVRMLPPAPGISFMMLDCATYTVELDAIGPSYGTYNWSSGDMGMVVDVMGGGAYRVWYTDTFGCQSHSDTYVPKDPREYLWVFPTGCYGPFCLTDTSRYIVGPIQPFYYWNYQDAATGIVQLEGWGTPVGAFHLTASGEYNMVLDNALCRDTSGNMSVTFIPCKGCDVPQYQLSTYSTPCAPQIPIDSCCNIYIVLQFPNVDGYPLFASVTVTGGAITPGGMVLYPGMNIDTFQFIPMSGFKCSWVYFTINYADKAGMTHACLDSIFICPCNKNASGHKGPGIVETQPGINGLNLVPNPAQNTVRIDYTASAAGATLDVYDMTGRLISSYATPDSSGSWQLPLDSYAGGFYIVTLKEKGWIMLQKKLSIIR